MRVYVPLTLAGLARLRRAGQVGPAPLIAYAVTPALREWYRSGNEEELEYAALSRAARAALPLLAAEPEAPRRRVVLAADVPERAAVPAAAVDPRQELPAERLGELRVTESIPLVRFAAVHIDDAEAEPDVAAAAEAVAAAGRGDVDAHVTVDGAAEHELLWYAVQEIDQLV